MTVETKPLSNTADAEDPSLVEADDIEDGDDDVNGDPPGAGKHLLNYCTRHRLFNDFICVSGEGKKKKKKKKPKKKKLEQSDPPRTGLSKFFPDGTYPVGEIQYYKDECVYTPNEV